MYRRAKPLPTRRIRLLQSRVLKGPDYEGLELSDLPTARSVALLAAADVLEEMTDHEHHPNWRFEITNEDGQTVLTIPFSEAQKRGSGRA